MFHHRRNSIYLSVKLYFATGTIAHFTFSYRLVINPLGVYCLKTLAMFTWISCLRVGHQYHKSLDYVILMRQLVVPKCLIVIPPLAFSTRHAVRYCNTIKIIHTFELGLDRIIAIYQSVYQINTVTFIRHYIISHEFISIYGSLDLCTQYSQ